MKTNGFSLIELMIIVAIIGILSLIAYPQYDRYLIKLDLTKALYEFTIMKNTQIMPALLEPNNLTTETFSGAPVSYSRFSLSNTPYTGGYPGYGHPLGLTKSRSNPTFRETITETNPDNIISDLFQKYELSFLVSSSGTYTYHAPMVIGYFGKAAHKQLHGLGFTYSGVYNPQTQQWSWNCYFSYADTPEGRKKTARLASLLPPGCIK